MIVAELLGDLRVITRMLKGLPSHGGAVSQLGQFYAPQAADYDRFRERLLLGRRELLGQLGLTSGDRVIEFGAGTGRMLDWYGSVLSHLAQVDLVDLCQPLLNVAAARAAGQANVSVHLADACTWQPEIPASKAYFSYALSMIPSWFAAIDNAERALAPGGLIGVVDFQVAPRGGSAQGFAQGRFARHLWPLWFDHDGVRLSSDLLAYLQYRFETVELREARAPIPYLPGMRVPYFQFIGRKRAQGENG